MYSQLSPEPDEVEISGSRRAAQRAGADIESAFFA